MNQKSFGIKFLETIIDLISISLLPVIYFFKYSIKPMQGLQLTLLLIGLIYIYKDIFLPKKPNMYFNIVYLAFFLLVYFLNIKSSLQLIFILLSCQLFLLMISKTISKKSPTLSNLILNYLTPTFVAICLEYSLIKFINTSFLISILLINTFTFVLPYMKKSFTSVFILILYLATIVVIVFLNYLSPYSAIALAVVSIIVFIFKLTKKRILNRGLIRIALSLCFLIK